MITKTTRTITTTDGHGKVISVQTQVETIEVPDTPIVKVIETHTDGEGTGDVTQTQTTTSKTD